MRALALHFISISTCALVTSETGGDKTSLFGFFGDLSQGKGDVKHDLRFPTMCCDLQSDRCTWSHLHSCDVCLFTNDNDHENRQRENGEKLFLSRFCAKSFAQYKKLSRSLFSNQKCAQTQQEGNGTPLAAYSEVPITKMDIRQLESLTDIKLSVLICQRRCAHRWKWHPTDYPNIHVSEIPDFGHFKAK